MKQKKAKLMLYIVISGFATVFLYIVLHEFGHTIVMLSAGARITEFSILGAHVRGEGGSYTNISDLWLHANGAVFPLVISYVYLLLYRKDSKNTFYNTFSWVFGLIPASSLLAWVVIPFAYMSGNAPEGDDVTLFLYNFSQGHSPLLVSAAAVLLIGVSITLLIRKKVFHNFIEELLHVR